MNSRYLASFFAGLLVWTMLSSGTLAQPTAHAPGGADPAKVELAKRHYALGELYYEQGNYAKAITAFRESYKLSGQAALLFNIGRCREALGELAEALRSFEDFAASLAQPDPNLNARIANLRARIAASREPAKTPTPAPTSIPPQPPSAVAPARSSAPAPSPATKPAPASADAAAPDLAPPADEHGMALTKASSSPGGWMRPTAWALLGVGAAAIGTGVVLGVMARSRADDITRAYKDGGQLWTDWADTDASGRALEKGMIASVVIGSVLASGGVVLHLLAPRYERRVAITPIAGGSFAGLSAMGSF